VEKEAPGTKASLGVQIDGNRIITSIALVVDKTDGPYRLTKTVVEAISQNLKNLILTNPGERIMDPDFGVGIRRYLFELANTGFQGDITRKIIKQARKYLSSVEILDIRYTPGSSYRQDLITIEETGALYVHILYKISSSDISNVLTLPISN